VGYQPARRQSKRLVLEVALNNNILWPEKFILLLRNIPGVKVRACEIKDNVFTDLFGE
jgi:hypothetical protein